MLGSFGMPLRKNPLRRLWQALGPGLTTGAADDDPSGIATYSQAGAQFGFALTWTMFLTLPFMAAIQIISACFGRRFRDEPAMVIGAPGSCAIRSTVRCIIA
jgi:Mn2+/Fe2+ NRAMP family transporter